MPSRRAGATRGVQLTIDGAAAAVRRAREQRRWTREQLADRAGISAAAIAQIESGRRKDIRLSTLMALAAALDISLDELTGGAAAPSFAHRALLYSNNDDFVDVAVAFLMDGITRAERPLAVTSADKVASIRRRLGRRAADVTFADSSAWYSSPADALAGYRDYLGTALTSGAKAVRILGEPVWTGRSRGSVKRWIRYESVINMVFAQSPATVVCPYDTRTVSSGVFRSAHRTHPELMAGHSDLSNPDYTPPDQLLLEP
jgi:transcriptional regulator with XRE-family HTH domain